MDDQEVGSDERHVLGVLVVLTVLDESRVQTVDPKKVHEYSVGRTKGSMGPPKPVSPGVQVFKPGKCTHGTPGETSSLDPRVESHTLPVLTQTVRTSPTSSGGGNRVTKDIEGLVEESSQ